MSNPKAPCVFPSPTETELATLDGGEPGGALRVRVEPAAQGEGYVRLEQLAWSADLGWYCQKSFIIPGPLVRSLVTELRKADCFLPRQANDSMVPIPFRAHVGPPHDAPDAAQRRDA
jgi:hypothetical protein